MKFTIFGLLLFLAACNGSTEVVQKVPYSDPALVAKIAALTQALAAATHEQAMQAKSLSSLQLIGKVHVTASAERVMAIGRAAETPPNFGPCTDMGVLIGRGGPDSSIPLASALESFQTCTGYSYTISTLTGTIQGPPYAAWDGLNCTGNLFIITDVPGDGFNPQVVNNGVVFTSPVDGLVYMIPAGSVPQLTQIQSAMNLAPGGGSCGSPDVEMRMTVQAILNDVSITGVQSTSFPLPITITAP